MNAYRDLVRRIVSRSGIPSSGTRRDLERELQTHLEDSIEDARSQGYEDAEAAQVVCGRFGDPDGIAHEFARAHRFERLARTLMLLATSILAVAGLILSLQLLLALLSGAPLPHAFPRLREQAIGFSSIVLGYVGVYLEQRLFHRHRMTKAFALNTALFLLLFAPTFFVFHLTTLAPVPAFLSGVGVRMIQQTAWRPVWFLGTAVPMIAAFLGAGKLLSAGHDFPLWAAALIRWVGLTAACHCLTLLTRNHEAHSEAGTADL